MNKVPVSTKSGVVYAIVDQKDYEWLRSKLWVLNGWGYAATTTGTKGNTLVMHRMINETPVGMETDHINRDKLDNRRANL